MYTLVVEFGRYLGERNAKKYLVRSSKSFKNVFPPAVHIGGYHPNWTQYGRYPPMWTAGGKSFLKLLEDLTRYFFAFLAPKYLPNSTTNGFMNFSTQPSFEIDQIYSI